MGNTGLLRHLILVVPTVLCGCLIGAPFGSCGNFTAPVTCPLDGTVWIAVDDAGNAYVTGNVSHNAFKITPAGNITEIIGGTGDGAGDGI